MDYPSFDIVSTRLRSYAVWYAGSKGYSFGAGAAGAIESMAGEAAEKMLEEARNTGPPEKAELIIRQAEAAISLFIDTMIAAAGEIPGYAQQNEFRIGEDTFSAAWGKLCPLWPIC